MIVSLFFFLICFDRSASSASTRCSRSASEVVSGSVSVVAVVLMSGHFPDHVAEAVVIEHLGLDQLVAADLGPTRHVGTGAGFGPGSWPRRCRCHGFGSLQVQHPTRGPS